MTPLIQSVCATARECGLIPVAMGWPLVAMPAPGRPHRTRAERRSLNDAGWSWGGGHWSWYSGHGVMGHVD